MTVLKAMAATAGGEGEGIEGEGGEGEGGEDQGEGQGGDRVMKVNAVKAMEVTSAVVEAEAEAVRSSGE